MSKERIEALIAQGDEQGFLLLSDVERVAGELDSEQLESLYEQLDAHAIEIRDDEGREDRGVVTYANGDLAAATVDSLQLFLREMARYPLLTASRGDRARQADRAWRPTGEGTNDQLQPPPRRLDRQALPGS